MLAWLDNIPPGAWELGLRRCRGCNRERDWKCRPLMCSSGFGWWAGLLAVPFALSLARLLACLPAFLPALLVHLRLAVALGVAPKLARARWLGHGDHVVSKWWRPFRSHEWVREFGGLDPKPVRRMGCRIRTPHGRRRGNGRGRTCWGCGTGSTSMCTWLLNEWVGCCRERKACGMLKRGMSWRVKKGRSGKLSFWRFGSVTSQGLHF